MAGISGFGNNNLNNVNLGSINQQNSLINAGKTAKTVENAELKDLPIDIDDFIIDDDFFQGDIPTAIECSASWGGFWDAFWDGYGNAGNSHWDQNKHWVPASGQAAGSLGMFITQCAAGVKAGVEYLRGEGR